MKAKLRDRAQVQELTDVGTKKHAAKYVPLCNEFGELKLSDVKLPGRHACECQATKHELVNNCLRCGRIVCEQEGSGPCLFCGNLVCTPEEQTVLNENTKRSAKLRSKLIASNNDVAIASSLQEVSDSLLNAIENKNRLLEFDRSSAKRTAVIDDECDYFNYSDTWLTEEEREALRQKHEALRKLRFKPRDQLKYTFDFAGRKIVSEEKAIDMYTANSETYSNVPKKKVDISEYRRVMGVDRNRTTFDTDLQYVPSAATQHAPNINRKKSDAIGTESEQSRVQDPESQLIADDGKCLSMHQPYGSLLVKGIKHHEGRVWYTAHRGRLWVAAAAYKPSMEDIDRVEAFYRSRCGKGIQFPKSYPTGCLLGCVEVLDCLPQERYLEKFPEGESESPYVLICTNAQELTTKMPISGSHKIYKLDPTIHSAARNMLRVQE